MSSGRVSGAGTGKRLIGFLGSAMSTFSSRRTRKPRSVTRPGLRALAKRDALRLLNRGEPPGIRSDGPHEGPELLELHRLGAVAFDDLSGTLIHRVVEQVREEVHGDVVLAALLPRFRDVDRAHRDILEPVDPALTAQAIAVLLEDVPHLGGDHPRRLLHVTVHPPCLHLEEDVGGRVAEAGRIETRIHLADIGDAPIEIARPDLHRLSLVRGGLVRLRRGLTLPLATAGTLAIARLGRGLPPPHHAEEEEGPARDEEDLEHTDAATHATHAVAEEHATEETAEGEAGQAAHQTRAPAGTLRLRLLERRGRRRRLARRRRGGRGTSGRRIAARATAATRATAAGPGPRIGDEEHRSKSDDCETRNGHGSLHWVFPPWAPGCRMAPVPHPQYRRGLLHRSQEAARRSLSMTVRPRPSSAMASTNIASIPLESSSRRVPKSW